MKKNTLNTIVHARDVVTTLKKLQEKEFKNRKHNLILKEFLQVFILSDEELRE